jgi:hypothetical protein
VGHQNNEDVTQFSVATGERRGQDRKIKGVKETKGKG